MTALRFAIFVFAFTSGALSLPGHAAAQGAQEACPVIPEMPWWYTDPERITSEVNSSHDGDWDKYIARWVRQRDAMEEIAVSGRRAVVRSHNVTLEGKSLTDYIEKLDTRIEALHCLAKNQGDAPGASADAAPKAPQPGADCQALPRVQWWGEISNANLVAVVEERFSGDWKKYRAYWENELRRMTVAFNKSEPAILNDLGFALSGSNLALHIADVAQLLATVHCLTAEARS